MILCIIHESRIHTLKITLYKKKLKNDYLQKQ